MGKQEKSGENIKNTRKQRELGGNVEKHGKTGKNIAKHGERGAENEEKHG